MERLTTEYSFNIQATPTEASASKLAARYSQLSESGHIPHDDSDAEAASDLSQPGSDNEQEADHGNPYDFRHFLDPDSQSSSPTRSVAATPRIDASTASPRPRTQQPAGVSKPAPKAAQPLRSRPKPVAQRKRQSAPTTSRAADVPQVRLDRRASTREMPASSQDRVRDASPAAAASSDEDEDAKGGTDGLIIDFGDDPEPNRRLRDFSFQLPNDGSGPISLRSAANSASPSSRLHTPARRAGSADEDVIDLPGGETYSEDDEDADGNSVASQEDDGDIDPLSLPSPAQPRPAAADAEIDDDDVADLEAEMMQGLASQEEEELREAAETQVVETQVVETHVDEESDESEAE